VNRAFSGCTSLTGVYFEGNLPRFFKDSEDWGPISFFSPAVILYYRAATEGWSPRVAGRPTALWRVPPAFGDWIHSTALLSLHPEASGPADDPDQDGMSNEAEMLAGTDPTDPFSVLDLESRLLPEAPSPEDRIPIITWKHAIYIRSVPGKTYGIQVTDSLGGPWRTEAVVTATSTQTRLILSKPQAQAFYRVILAQ
jgi:hypothetical protein